MKRRTLPRLESLEQRELLDAGGAASSQPLRQLLYTTPQGLHVAITLFGQGSLIGSTVEPSGALDLVYQGTNSQTGIVGKVTGGNHHVFLAGIHNSSLSIDDLSGFGGQPLGVVNLKSFDLIPGGNINMTAGVSSLFLNSMGANSEVHLTALPQSSSTSSSGTTSSFSSSSTTTSLPGFNPSFGQNATGVNVVINHVNATAQQFPAVGDPQIFGYDATANSLIRFDAKSGSVLQTIPLSTPASPHTGVSLGRVNGGLVVLVGSATTVQVFNATTGSPMGSFSTSALAGLGFTAIDGLASTDTSTYLVDSTANSTGIVQAINLSQSLATGQVVTVGSSYTPQQQFYLSGGAAGIAAQPIVFLQGAGFLDTFQPNLTQNGVLDFGPAKAGSAPTELKRAELPGPLANLNAGNPPTTTLPAMGSVGQKLAIVTSVAKGENMVTLYNTQSLAVNGTLVLKDPNRIVDLSESFHPEIGGTALVDIQGNLRSFRAKDAQGLVINESGFLNLVQIERAANSEVIGLPVGHTRIPFRKNVLILSTSRSVGARGGVYLDPKLPPPGPLSLPNNNA